MDRIDLAVTSAADRVRDVPEDFKRFPDDAVDEKARVQVAALLSWACSASKGNSLFVTDCDRVGLGGNGISAGDRVYVLYQGRTPLVLHPCPGPSTRFLVVSECYVDGLMYGEAAQLGKSMHTIEIE